MGPVDRIYAALSLSRILSRMPVADRLPLEVASPKSALIKVARLTLSHAQILALNSTPVTFGDAPGANRVNLPISIGIIKKAAAGGYTSNPVVNITIGTGNIFSSAVGLSNASNQVFSQNSILTSTLFSAVTNQAFTVQALSNNTAGNAANSLTIVVIYFQAEMP